MNLKLGLKFTHMSRVGSPPSLDVAANIVGHLEVSLWRHRQGCLATQGHGPVCDPDHRLWHCLGVPDGEGVHGGSSGDVRPCSVCESHLKNASGRQQCHARAQRDVGGGSHQVLLN